MNHCSEQEASPRLNGEKITGELLIALAGQPNMGKSTIFNALTGLNQHVGNWPGKTVEKKEGRFSYQGQSCLMVDLPGTYSLTASSPEEVITREYILQSRPDLVIAVVNAANLERSLYLLSELVQLSGRIVVALNMMDVAEQENIQVDPVELEHALQIPVVPMIATHVNSIHRLMQTALQVVSQPLVAEPSRPELPAKIQFLINQLHPLIVTEIPDCYPYGWLEMKLLEGDSELTALMKAQLSPQIWEQVDDILLQNEDAMLTIVSNRYEWIARVIKYAVKYNKIGQIGLTEKIDRVAAHPVWGLFVLAGILGLVFWLTFHIGTPIQEWMSSALVSPLAEFATHALSGAAPWVQGLVVDGIIGGVGSVLTFLPILVIFFGIFGILEDTGYMARAAYVMDNFMHLMGLHGKSFLPLFLGFGCNVPSILGTRVIDTREARLETILVAPLIPCTARLAVIAFMTPAFFGSDSTLVSLGLVFGSLLMLVLLGTILNKTIFKGKRSAFIMEMPLYHAPNPRTIGLLIWQRSVSFIKKAGTTILGISCLIWLLSYLPGGDIQTSYLATFGHWIEPVGRSMGLDWKLTLALLTSFMAKENAIATLGVLFGNVSGSTLSASLAAIYSRSTALSFLTVTMLFIPCAATLAVIKQESGSWKWVVLNVMMMLVVSITAGILVFHVANWIGIS